MPKELIPRDEFEDEIARLQKEIDYLKSTIEVFASFEPKPLKRYSKKGFSAGGFKIFKYLPENHERLKVAIEKYGFEVDKQNAGYVLVKTSNKGE